MQILDFKIIHLIVIRRYTQGFDRHSSTVAKEDQITLQEIPGVNPSTFQPGLLAPKASGFGEAFPQDDPH